MIQGKPIIENTLEKLEAIFEDIIIITNNEDELRDYKHIRMACDIYHNKGPLGGLHSAMANTDRKAVFLVASDMPELNSKVIRYILENYERQAFEALIPQYQGHIEPLHAVYGREIFERLDDFIRNTNDYSIREFLKLVDEKYLLIDKIKDIKNPFLNINSADDLQKWY